MLSPVKIQVQKSSLYQDIRTTATNVFRLDLLALFLVQNPEKMGKTAIELGRCIRSYLRAYQVPKAHIFFLQSYLNEELL